MFPGYPDELEIQIQASHPFLYALQIGAKGPLAFEL